MTLRAVDKPTLVQALRSHPDKPGVAAFFEALMSDARASYVITDSTAAVLEKTLRTKYRLARERGKSFDGDEELFRRLTELGNQQVVLVTVDQAERHCIMFFVAHDLEPIALVVMSR